MTPEIIKAFRFDQRMTQEALAARLGVSRVTVAKWESGGHPPPTHLGLALAAIRAGLDPIA